MDIERRKYIFDQVLSRFWYDPSVDHEQKIQKLKEVGVELSEVYQATRYLNDDNDSDKDGNCDKVSSIAENIENYVYKKHVIMHLLETIFAFVISILSLCQGKTKTK